MKYFILFFSLFLILTAAFPQESQQYDYFLEIKGKRDVDVVFNTIKAWIGNYNHYNCTIKNADGNYSGFDYLLIRKMSMINGTGNEIAVFQFQFNGKIINLILSENEILGLTKEYKDNEIDVVFNVVYSFYSNNML